MSVLFETLFEAVVSLPVSLITVRNVLVVSTLKE